MQTPSMPSTTSPKKHPPGQTYVSDRETQYRYNFLAPSPEQVEIAEYSFACACEFAGQIVHAETWLPTRRTGVLTCPDGNRSYFHQRCHQLFSFLNNPRIENVGNVTWKPDAVVDVPLCDGPPRLRGSADPSGHVEPTLLDVMLLPVTEEYADNRAHYPGFCVDHRHWGSAVLVRRPESVEQNGRPDSAVYIALPTVDWLDRVLAVDDTDSPAPLVAHCRDLGTLTPAQYHYLQRQVARVTTLRKQHPELPDDHPMFWEPFISPGKLAEARAHYRTRLRDAERLLRNQRRKAGRRVLGKDLLQNLDPWSFPGDEHRAQMTNGVPPENTASRRRPPLPDPCEERRFWRGQVLGPPEWVAFMVWDAERFEERHRRDLNRWRNGRDFAVEFPYGTIRARLHANVQIRGGP